jgi:hypothetical protein
MDYISLPGIVLSQQYPPGHYCTKVRTENPDMSKMFLEDGRGLRGCRGAYLASQFGPALGTFSLQPIAASMQPSSILQPNSFIPTLHSDNHARTWSSLVPSDTKEFPHQSIIHAIPVWQLHRDYDAGVCSPLPRFP